MIHLVPTYAPRVTHLTQQETDSTYAVNKPRRGARIDAIDMVAHVRPPAHPPLSKLQSDVAIEDCAILLNAVKGRLRLTISECPNTPIKPLLHDTEARIRTAVLECVAALDQLHTTLTHEIDRRRHLKLEVFDVQNALMQVRIELFITRRREREFRVSA